MSFGTEKKNQTIKLYCIEIITYIHATTKKCNCNHRTVPKSTLPPFNALNAFQHVLFFIVS